MNLIQNPELLDRLAAAHALGTLRGGARRRFEHLAREHAQVRATALLWQERWSALSEVQAPVQPDAAVWTRIDNLLQAEKERAAQTLRRPQAVPASGLSWWRNAAWAGAFATVAAVAVGLWSHQDLRQASAQQLALLQSQLQTAQAAPQIQYVAVLADGRQEASMLVTFDARQNRLVLQRVGGFREGADQSLQLWALPPQGGPRSLGVLGQGRLEQLPAQEAQVQTVPMLAISLEPRGGVPSETGPTGPVLFTGALIRRDL
ncbi:anti-sigma factor [Pantoea sp. 18069]|uniref:anti-sigma factor n=1 Tax=Pantoea sp. 18069 TaxID=2681415 RepID=UPI00135719E3|nr:anti-sigma factor [Pantoea sp. 18069]